jgi:hypothetical protein
MFIMDSWYDPHQFANEAIAAYQTVTPPADERRFLSIAGGGHNVPPWTVTAQMGYRNDARLGWLREQLGPFYPNTPTPT